MNRLLREFRVFAACSSDMRLLLIGNCIYAFVLPVIEIFVAAYVLRATRNANSVLLYQISVYIATPVAFLLNGYLLRWLPSRYLYAMGMFSSGAALLVLTISNVSTWTMIGFCGAAMGIATGFFWANGNLLAVASTNDANRNYFYGVEMAFFTLASVIVPWIVGSAIEWHWTLQRSDSETLARYRTIALIATVLTAIAALVVSRGRFRTSSDPDFLALRFQRLWYWLLLLAGLRGVTQGFILTAPALLILRTLGREGILGKIEAIGGCVAAMCAYWLGRYSRPEHRIWIFGFGVISFWIGSMASGALFDALGTLIFMGCLIVAKPLIDLAYGPMEFRTIDVISAREGRSSYTYLMSHEMGVLSGRLLGCGLFLFVGSRISEEAAVRYALPIVASLQLPAILVARKLPRVE